MTNNLSVERVTLIVTTICNLRCKLCSNLMPRFNPPANEPVENLIKDTDSLFALIDYIKYFHYVGGEVFTRKDMASVYENCLRHSAKFDTLRIITNGTLIPCENDLKALQNFGDKLEIQISDYGVLSKTEELTRVLRDYNLPFTLKTYHGKNQHFGGWTDNTKFEDLGLSKEELMKHFIDCGNRKINCYHLYQGKLYGCPPMFCTHALGIVEPNRDDFIDLNNDNMSRDEKRDIVSCFGTKPYALCPRCVTYAPESERFPAAEQI